MIQYLVFQTGVDIPFPAGKLVIHQPTIKEIAYIGEQNFYMGCEVLRFSKNSLSLEDKNNLVNQSDFDIIMSIMKEKSNPSTQKSAINALTLLSLMFPAYEIHLQENRIVFIKDNNGTIEEGFLDNQNYSDFKQILVPMFCLQNLVEQEYNPSGELSSKIAEKLRKRKQKLQQEKEQSKQSFSIFDRYISIIAVGLGKDKRNLMQYTVYQLMDEFDRMQAKINFDMTMKAKLAGAKDVKDVMNWMDDLHHPSNNN